MPESTTLRAAQGWLELGLPAEALCEIRSLPGAEQQRPAALRLRLAAEMERGAWNAAADSARLLCLRRPGDPGPFLLAAFCLHETGDTLAARDWLMRGPRSLLDEPLFHYNLACYLAVLGDRGRARHFLERACRMDPSLADAAGADPDLEGLGGG